MTESPDLPGDWLVSAQPACASSRQAEPACPDYEPDENAALEVVFSPAEPVLNPGAAKAVLDLLLHAYQGNTGAPCRGLKA
jgi:hypothetical protein